MTGNVSKIPYLFFPKQTRDLFRSISQTGEIKAQFITLLVNGERWPMEPTFAVPSKKQSSSLLAMCPYKLSPIPLVRVNVDLLLMFSAVTNDFSTLHSWNILLDQGFPASTLLTFCNG